MFGAAGLVLATGMAVLAIIWCGICYFQVEAFGFGVTPEKDFLTALAGFGVLSLVGFLSGAITGMFVNPVPGLPSWRELSTPSWGDDVRVGGGEASADDLPGWVNY